MFCFSAEDRQYLWDVACAVAAKLDAFSAARVAARAGGGHTKAAEAIEAFKEELKGMRATPKSEDEEKGNEEGGKSEEEAKEDGDDAAEAAGEGL